MTGVEELTHCFSRQVAAWFAEDGRTQIADRARLRQMNMALALATSRWLEFADVPQPVRAMHAWLTEVERRAEQRGATARADAFRLARTWFDACGGRS
jgi:hypothetical protein